MREFAEILKQDLGSNYYLRADYSFAIPIGDRLIEEKAEAVIFSHPVPSAQTAEIGFACVESDQAEVKIASYAYLGAPLLVAQSNNHISLYRFRGSPIAEKIEEISLSTHKPEVWVRESVRSAVESPQLSLGFDSSKDLLVHETRLALAARVKALVELIGKERDLNDLDSFKVAMATIRELSLGIGNHPHLNDDLVAYSHELAGRFESEISFANLPPGSIAELYESFAISYHARKRKGVVYTPAWLARYVISRLAIDAFRSGSAVDPTCGSGTFLVCFLEKLVEEQAKNKGIPEPADLAQAVIGIDIDPVAIEAARLSLDFFADALGVEIPTWNLVTGDATQVPINGEWVIGNLPFGYRTHKGKYDISTVIIENIVNSNVRSRGISMILPDSLAYTEVASKARELLRSNFQLHDITRLPDNTFETSVARTMLVAGRKGKQSREVLIREVTARDLKNFKSGHYISRSYVSRLPEHPQDPWRFSPFNNAFEQAEKLGTPLGSLARVHIGLQIYRHESEVLSFQTKHDKPLLTDPRAFASWKSDSYKKLPELEGERGDVRRPGPWDLFSEEKVIVRATTQPGYYDRLAAIPDLQGIWFTDKFVGIWPLGSSWDITAIAAFLQTRFARLWFDSNNPSRKLRIQTLNKLPVPRIPVEWWQRASKLVKPNMIVRPPMPNSLMGVPVIDQSGPDWEWFNAVVENALGISSSSAFEMEEWLQIQAS